LRRDKFDCAKLQIAAILPPHCGRSVHRSTVFLYCPQHFCSPPKQRCKKTVPRFHNVLARWRRMLYSGQDWTKFKPPLFDTVRVRGPILTEVVRQSCFLAVAVIRFRLRHVGREITRFSRRGTATEILGGYSLKSIFSKSGNAILFKF